jgi:hypothetical protein
MWRRRRCSISSVALLERRGGLPTFHIVDMQINQSAERLRTSRAPAGRCMAPIDLHFSFARPFAGMVVTKERLARPAPLEADLDLPVSGW